MQQKTILFMMAPAFGHLNCTFSFANRLKEEGYRVVYASIPSLEEYLNGQGFETVHFNSHVFSFGNESAFGDASKVDKFLHRLVDRLSNIRLNQTIEAIEEMNRMMVKLRPDMLFLDSFYPFNYLFLKGHRPLTYLLQTMPTTKRRKGIPALNSRLLPLRKTNKFNSIAVEWSWWKYFFSRAKDQVQRLGDHPFQIASRILKKRKSTHSKQLDFNVMFRPHIQGVEELVLAPRSIDFNDINPSDQLYLSSTLNTFRRESEVKGQLLALMEKLKNTYDKKQWILCSLGTLNVKHNSDCVTFFSKVINVFKEKSNWEVIIVTGSISPQYFGPQRPNIHLFDRVPQLEILRYCSAMITHGGMNSFLECINHLTPMLAYPLNNDWDQNGNSSRIVHYGLGLRGAFNKDSEEMIRNKLEQLIENSKYLENIKAKRAEIKAETGLEQAITMIKSKIPLQELQRIPTE